MKFQYNDGGREKAGFKGDANDCVTRAIAIVSGKPYIEIYKAINELAKDERTGKRKSKKSSARNGVFKFTYHKYLSSLGFKWTPTMTIGSGCKVHLRETEIPQEGKFIVRLSKHLTSVIDGVIHDTHNPDRNGWRCVYGYWTKSES